VVVKEVQRDQGFGAVGLAARLGIMKEPARRVLRPLEMSIVTRIN
jgi:ribosomal protein S25